MKKLPRLAVLNILIGFIAIFLAAALGTFVATDMTRLFIHDPASLNTWNLTLTQSAHGHANLFGVLHVLFGLTLPYSMLGDRTKLWQTIGLALGTSAMSFGMLIRATESPSEGFDPSGMAIGIMLSATFVALGLHIYGLMKKLMK